MIEVIVLLLGLLLFGSYKKDFTALLFAGFGFILYGLEIYSSILGIGAISIGFGLYIAFRSAIDLITLRRVDNG